MLATKVPYPVFFDRDGTPLDGGSVYFGVANDNPETAPATVYWDALATQPAAQPLRTTAGFISRAGTAANVFIGTDYSVLVKDRAGRVVYYARSAAEFDAGYQLIGQLAASGGSALIGFIQSGASSAFRTLQAKLRDMVSLLDKGAVGDGITNDFTAVQAAITEHAGKVIDGLGLTYKINSPLTGITSGTVIQNATFDFSSMPAQAGQDKCFAISGTKGSAVALTANTAVGSATVTVGSTASFSAGQLVWLESTTVWDSSTSTNYGQMARVKSVDSGTQLSLYSTVNLGFTTAASATISPITPVKGVKFRNCRFIGAAANSQAGIYAEYCEDLVIEDNCRFENFDFAAVVFWRCWYSSVTESRIRFANSTTTAYGVGIYGGSYGCSVTQCYGEDLRHLVTVGDNDGVNMYWHAGFNHAAGSKDAGIDSHSASMFGEIIGNTVEMSATQTGSSNHDGIISQGCNTKIIGNTVIGPKGTGIYYQPIYQDGTDTSVEVVDNTVILADTGLGSSSQRGVYVLVNPSNGADIETATIRGNKVSGAQGNANGCTHIEATVSKASGYLRNLVVTDNASVDIASTSALVVRTNATSAAVSKVIVSDNEFQSDGGRVVQMLADGTSSTIQNLTGGRNILDGGTSYSWDFNGSVGTIWKIRLGKNAYVNPVTKVRVTGTSDYVFDDAQDEPPTVITAATHTVGPLDRALIGDRAGTITVTLPAANECPGRELDLNTVQAQAIDSASSNVRPINDNTTAGTALVPNTDGAWVTVKSMAPTTNVWKVIRKG